MKKLTVNIDEDTYRLLKGKLGYKGLSFQKWAEQQIKTFVQKSPEITPPPVRFANAKQRGPIEHINQIARPEPIMAAHAGKGADNDETHL